jgi:tetratricopeptide (TPR) repeat protein
MPFGVKPDGQGATVDFDAVYRELIEPAVQEAGMQALRADQELVGGLIHKPMYERLILADYAVADLTTANANVFYEVGVRHAVRPLSTVLIGADIQRTPFDLAPDRVLPYTLDRYGRPGSVEQDGTALTDTLRFARERTTKDPEADSPVFQLLRELPVPQIDRLKTDTFRQQAAYSVEAKRRLAAARIDGAEAVRAFENELGSIEDVEAGVLVDVLLSYRAVKAWPEMIALVERMPAALARTKLICEQYGFALNRDGRSDDAEIVLRSVLDEHGASSETYGLIGRVFKDRWEAALKTSALQARGHLEQAIDAYRKGFESDWRDAYPGINAVTLMEIRDPGGPGQQALIAVVQYANRRRIEGGGGDYWDHATRLELGVLARDRDEAYAAAADALAAVREPWEPETTARNLALIRQSRATNGETLDWADDIEQELQRSATATR